MPVIRLRALSGLYTNRWDTRHPDPGGAAAGHHGPADLAENPAFRPHLGIPRV